MAQCRYYPWTLGPNVGIISRHGGPGLRSHPHGFGGYASGLGV